MIRRGVLLAVVSLLALVASCSGGTELPPAQRLLTQAAQAMRQVDTVRFELTIKGGGTVAGVPIRGAQGVLTQQGNAKGSVRLDRGGQLVELRFVLLGDTVYLQGPTGGFQKYPAAFATAIYDPSVILDPQSGVAALLAQATSATTEAREEVNGVEAYRVQDTFPGSVLDGLIPDLSSDTEGTVWIAVESNRLVKARFPLPGGGTAVVRLSEFNAPVEITPPQ